MDDIINISGASVNHKNMTPPPKKNKDSNNSVQQDKRLTGLCTLGALADLAHGGILAQKHLEVQKNAKTKRTQTVQTCCEHETNPIYNADVKKSEIIKNAAETSQPQADTKSEQPEITPKEAVLAHVENKIDIETVKKELEARNEQDRYGDLSGIEINDENAELMHKILTMKQNPDGTGGYRFSAVQIEILSKLDQNTVDKLIIMRNNPDGTGGYRFNTSQIEDLSKLDQKFVDKVIDMRYYPDGTGEYRFNADEIERLSKLDQKIVDKVINMKEKAYDGSERYRFWAADIATLSTLDQSLVDKFLTMAKNPDGTGGYRFNASQIKILSDKEHDQNSVMYLIEKKNSDKSYRFDSYDICKMLDKCINLDTVIALVDKTIKKYGIEIPRFDAVEITNLSNKQFDQDTVLKLVNMTDNECPRFSSRQIVKLMDNGDAGDFARNLADKVNKQGNYLYDYGTIVFLKHIHQNKPDVDVEKVLFETAGINHDDAAFRFISAAGDDKHCFLVNKNNNMSYKFDRETMKLIAKEENGELTNLETGTTIAIKENITRKASDSSKQIPTKREIYIKKSTGEELTQTMKESQIKGEYEIYQIDSDGRKNLIGLCEYDGKGGRHIEKNLKSLDGTRTDYVYADDVQGNRFLYYKITSPDGTKLFETAKKHKVISDTHYQTFEDGKGYDIENFDDRIVVTKLDENNQKTSDVIERRIIDLPEEISNKLKSGYGDPIRAYKIASQYPGKWVDREMLPVLKQLSGGELFALNKGTPYILGAGASKNNAFYMPVSNNGLIAMSPETNSFAGVFEHELGHQKFHNLDLSKNKELSEIYEKEKELFTSSFPNEHITSINYFLKNGNMSRGINETTAETNLLLNIPQSCDLIQDRTVILQQYFPNTIAKIGELLRKHETL